MLVTGGAGFIGSNFIHYVLKHHQDITIFNLDKLTYAGSLHYLNHLPNDNRHHFIQGDICDLSLVRTILASNSIDTIVHFAAESHVDRSINKPAPFIETNIVGTFCLLEAARQQWIECDARAISMKRFHHISTDEVYGALEVNEPPFTEYSRYQPRSPYSASKASSDHLVHAYFHTYQLPITLSHCSNNYGPNQDREKFIPTIINACLEEKEIPVYGQGKQIRDWLYVEDHCRGIMDIIQHGTIGETYDMGGNNEWENIALARFICLEMDHLLKRPYSHLTKLKFVTDRLGHDFRYAINTKKICTELGWQATMDMKSGIQKTIDYYYKCAKTAQNVA